MLHQENATTMDIEIEKGARFTIEFQLTENDGNDNAIPVNITGRKFTLTIKESFETTTELFNIDMEVSDASLGIFRAVIDATDTDIEQLYGVFDIFNTSLSNVDDSERLVYGNVKFKNSVRD